MSRWDLYLDQSNAMGLIALALFIVEFGLFAWWYMIQVSTLPLIVRLRSQILTAFWVFVAALYLAFFGWLSFGWPS